MHQRPRLSLFALPLAFVLAGGCLEATNPFDPNTPPELQQPAILVGTVSSNDTPLAGAVIALAGPGRADPVVTLADGAFDFSALVPGAYTLSATQAAHQPAVLGVTLLPGQSLDVGDLALTAIGDGDGDGVAHLQGRAQKGAQLARPEGAQDHSGVTVEVAGAGLRTVTNAAGNWDLFVQPGTYALSFSAPDHAASTVDNVVGTADTLTDVDLLVLAATPGTVSGSATLEDGSSPSDIIVSVAGVGTTTTGANGSFLLGSVPSGVHIVTLAKGGFATATVSGVAVVAGADTALVPLQLAIARGTITGSVDLVGRSDDSGVAVGLTGTPFSAVTSENGQFALSGVPVGSYELVASRDGFLRGVIGGVVVTQGGTTPVARVPLAPRLGDFDIDSGAAFTTDLEVNLDLVSDGAVEMCISESGSDCLATAGFEAFAAATTFTLSGGDGTKVIQVFFADVDGNVTGPFSSSIVLDGTAPFVPAGFAGVVLNGGSLFSNNVDGIVSAAFTAQDNTSGVALMQIAVDGSLDAEAFVPFQTTDVLTLSGPLVDGTKTVRVRFRDAAGNTSAVATATISLDRVPPSLTKFFINAEADAFSTSSTVTLTVQGAAVDTALMALSTTAGFAVTVFEPFTNSRVFDLAPGEGTRNAFIKLVDRAGNSSGEIGDTVIVDTVAPGGPSIELNEGDVLTRFLNVTADLTADGAVEMSIAFDGVLDTEGFEPFQASVTRPVPAGDGNKRVIALFRDAAGNQTTVVRDAIILDRTPPADPILSIANDIGGFVASESAVLIVNSSGADFMRIIVNQEAANCSTPPTLNEAAFVGAPNHLFTPAQLVLLPPNAAAANTGAPPANRCKFIQVLTADTVGNISALAQVGVELDTLKPDAPRIGSASTVIDDDNDGQKDFTVALAVDAVDHHLARYEVRNGDADFVPLVGNTNDFVDPACITNGISCSLKVQLRQTANTRTENRIEVRAVDLAGNVSPADLLIVTEDSDPPDAPATLTAIPSDQEVGLSWTASTDSDVAGYRVGYAFKNGAACPTNAAAYVGASLATEGPSPIDVGLNTTFRLTGFSNNIDLCLAVVAFDQTVVPAPQSSALTVTAATPTEIGLNRIARITSSQLGIGTGLPSSIAVRNGMLYVAATGATGGVLELDATDEACFALSDPAAFASCTNLKKSVALLSDPHDMKIHGGFVFVADGAAGTRIFRIEEGRAPSLFATLPLAGATAAKIALSVAVSGNFLAVGRSSTAVRTFDGVVDTYALDNLYAASPGAPALFGSLAQVSSGTFAGRGIFGFTSVDFENGVLAAGSQLAFVNVFGINAFGAPTQPAEGGGVVRLAGQFLYGANDDNGPDNDMHVIDFGAPVVDIDPAAGVDNRAPTVSRALGTASHKIELMGPYVLVAGRHLLDIYDASDRQSLRFVTTYASNFSNDNGGTAPLEIETNQGALAIDGNRIFFSSATIGEIDLLRLGDPARLESVSSIEEPGAGADAVLYADSLVQGRSDAGVLGQAPQALVHLGRQTVAVDFQNPSAAATAAVATENDSILFLNSAFGTTSTIERGTRNTTGDLAFFPSTPLPANVHAQGGQIRWPWAVVATTSGADFFNPTGIELRVFDLRPVFGAATQLSATTIATTAVAGFNVGPGTVAVHGGFVYVGVNDNFFNGSSGQASQGLYRATFNPHTGGVGVFAKVENGAVTGVYPWGRKVFFARNLGAFQGANAPGLGDLRAQTLADPDAWVSANVVTVSSHYAYEHRVAFSGPFVFFARDLDGVSVQRLSYNPTNFRPNPATAVLSFDPGADSHSVQVIGDRVYFHLLATGGLIFRTR